MKSTPFALNFRSPVVAPPPPPPPPPPGGGSPPLFGSQHLKLVEPGQRPVFVVPSQVSVGRQLPPDPHSGLIQHLTFSTSFLQNPDRNEPSAAAQSVVVTQTPGVPSMEQGPLTAARDRGRSGRRREMIFRENMVAMSNTRFLNVGVEMKLGNGLDRVSRGFLCLLILLVRAVGALPVISEIVISITPWLLDKRGTNVISR